MRCVRKHVDNVQTDNVNYMTQNACRATCGRYGALWPKPTGSTLLGEQLIKFNSRNIRWLPHLILLLCVYCAWLCWIGGLIIMRTCFFYADSICPACPMSPDTIWTRSVTYLWDKFEERAKRYAIWNIHRIFWCDSMFIRHIWIWRGQRMKVTVWSWRQRVSNSRGPFFFVQKIHICFVFFFGFKDSEVSVQISAETIFGARHGLETLSQLIVGEDGNTADGYDPSLHFIW